ncbi:Gfo/Idh/MocA family oxidoreductase [Rubrivirga sp. S365]|uniref:Gfo/Idh/MocA family protein n=1 Tax=Rubrivirga sp. S365 TaxID=3076080 RepID=UPI0028C8B93C|nr:Gfo/Idh/MocA family oxidoreductase [Rubrivirga sp. S365]MDT7855509.1 Gfo/Idh/MocA family oxidoreductase [Rubrivirga sp. S365]
MGDTIGWGVVGAGWVARDYVGPGIAASANGRVVAACDLDAAALDAFLPDHDLERTTSLDALLARDDVDAVYVATPNDAHLGPVRAAAAAGKAVLCEKPVARTLAEAEALLGAAQAAGVPYGTAFDQRFHPAHVALRELIAGGALGTVTAVRIRYACWTGPDWSPDENPHDNWRADPERAGGGAFLDLAPHGLDLTQVLLGEPITDVAALLQRRVHDYAVDDGAALVGRTEGGALLNLSVAYNCPDTFPRRELEVVGTRARALALNTMGQTPGGTLTLTDDEGGAEAVPFDGAASPFRLQVEAFADALLRGEPFAWSPAHDLHTMRLLDAALGEPSARVPAPDAALPVSA